MPANPVYVAAHTTEHSLIQALIFSVSAELLPCHVVQLVPLSDQHCDYIKKKMALANITHQWVNGFFRLECFQAEIMQKKLQTLANLEIISSDFLERALSQYPSEPVEKDDEFELSSLAFSLFHSKPSCKKSINDYQKELIASSLSYIFEAVFALESEDAKFVLAIMDAQNVSNEDQARLADLNCQDCVKLVHAILANGASHLSAQDGGFFNLINLNDANTEVTSDAVHAEIRGLIQYHLAQLSQPKISAKI